MNRVLVAAVLAVSLGAGGVAAGRSAHAQSAPAGGPGAKGNAPLKHAHTIDDGSAKPGANSFTEGQARQHILNSGYSRVDSLVKGKDGVWRGVAVHNGALVDVAMDFKGNVTEAAPAMMGPAPPTSMDSAHTASHAAAADTRAMGGSAEASERRRHPRRHHHSSRCADPGPNGVACSGVDSTGSGVSDREKRAIQAGAHP